MIWQYCSMCKVARINTYMKHEFNKRGWLRVHPFPKDAPEHSESYDYVCPECALRERIVGIFICPRCAKEKLVKGIAFCDECYSKERRKAPYRRG
jgi:hypothetical protein